MLERFKSVEVHQEFIDVYLSKNKEHDICFYKKNDLHVEEGKKYRVFYNFFQVLQKLQFFLVSDFVKNALLFDVVTIAFS